MPGTPEPEIRYFGEYSTFLGDRIRQHHIKSRKSVRGHDEHRLRIDCVDIPDFSLVNPFQAAQGGAEHRGM